MIRCLALYILLQISKNKRASYFNVFEIYSQYSIFFDMERECVMRNKVFSLILGGINALIFSWFPIIVYDITLKLEMSNSIQAGSDNALKLAFLSIGIILLINIACIVNIFKTVNKDSGKAAALIFVIIGWLMVTALFYILSIITGFFTSPYSQEYIGAVFTVICFIINFFVLIMSYFISLVINKIAIDKKEGF